MARRRSSSDSTDGDRPVYVLNLQTNQREIEMETLALCKRVLVIVLIFVCISVLVLLAWYQLLLIDSQWHFQSRLKYIDNQSASVSTTTKSPKTPHFYFEINADSVEPGIIMTTTTTTPTPTTQAIVLLDELPESVKMVREMARESFAAYSAHAWGEDALFTKTPNQPMQFWFGPGSGHTIVASMDTLWLMDLTEEFNRSRKWIEAHLDFGQIDKEVETCMVVQEYLGGLLSSYALTNDSIFFEKAQQIATILSPAYSSSTGLPYQKMNPKRGTVHNSSINSINSIGCQQLEYHYLYNLTSDPEYENRIQKIRKFFINSGSLYRSQVDVATGNWTSEQTILWINSLPKEFLQSGFKDSAAIELFNRGIESAEQFGLLATSSSGLRYVRSYNSTTGQFENNMNSHSCYLATLLALSSKSLESMQESVRRNSSMNLRQRQQEMSRLSNLSSKYIQLAEDLVETCHRASNSTVTGLPPDRFGFGEEANATIVPKNKFYFLGPELAEAYFVMFRLTKDTKYRDYAWDLGQSIHKHCRTPSGAYSALKDVTVDPAPQLNYQRPYFIGGTLKFLYLTMDFDPNGADDKYSLDKWVFNAVGHLIPVKQ